MDSIALWFASTLGQYVSKEVVIFIISMIPILELRGGLLVAWSLGVPILKAIPICIIGNIIPIPFILLFIRKIFQWMKKLPFFAKLIGKLEDRAMKKSDSIKKYEFWGLRRDSASRHRRLDRLPDCRTAGNRFQKSRPGRTAGHYYCNCHRIPGKLWPAGKYCGLSQFEICSGNL